MHVKHDNGIPPTILKDPINDDKTYIMRININTIIPSLPAVTAKKQTATFCHCWPSLRSLLTNILSPKTFTLIHPIIDEPKFAIHPRYTLIIIKFQKRSNVTMSLYN